MLKHHAQTMDVML